jgi:hypothetical protein
MVRRIKNNLFPKDFCHTEQVSFRVSGKVEVHIGHSDFKILHNSFNLLKPSGNYISQLSYE